MKEMGYKAQVTNGYVVVLPTTKPCKERPLKESEIGTGRPAGEMTIAELQSFFQTSKGFEIRAKSRA